MIVTAYFLAHGHWTVIPHQLEENFRDMRDSGFTAVAISFSESEMRYSRRAFELQVELAHRQGLKVFVIPSRLGGRFAGAPLMPGLWIAQHREAQVPGHAGAPVACLEHPPFRAWFKDFMSTLLTDYPLDGVIWDEPKYERLVSSHPDTRVRFGAHPTPEQMEDGFVDFLQDMTTHCLTLRPELAMTIFNTRNSSARFTAATCAVPGIGFAGYDGNLSRQSFFHEEPAWLKYRLESVWDRTLQECATAGKKSFALVENMLIPSAAIPEYEQNLDHYLATIRPDHLALYYYAHNNEDPETVHAVTRRLMRRHLSA